MIVLLDTNVVLRLDHVGNPHRDVAREAIERLFDEQHQPRIVPQVLYEYWVVATRPAESNGLGFSIEDAQRMLADLKELFAPFRDACWSPRSGATAKGGSPSAGHEFAK